MNPINYIIKVFAFTMLSAVLAAAVSPVFAAKDIQGKLWRQADESTIQSRGRRLIVPEKYLVLSS